MCSPSNIKQNCQFILTIWLFQILNPLFSFKSPIILSELNSFFNFLVKPFPLLTMTTIHKNINYVECWHDSFEQRFSEQTLQTSVRNIFYFSFYGNFKSYSVLDETWWIHSPFLSFVSKWGKMCYFLFSWYWM